MTYLWLRLLGLMHLHRTKVEIENKYVPKRILDNFNNRYLVAQRIQWFIRKGKYEVSFYLNQEYRYTIFTRNGDLIREFISIGFDRLPKVTLRNMVHSHGGFRISDILWDEFHREPHIRATLKKDKKVIEAEYDQNGQLLSSHTIDQDPPRVD